MCISLIPPFSKGESNVSVIRILESSHSPFEKGDGAIAPGDLGVSTLNYSSWCVDHDPQIKKES
jgi:hypothetical protein